MQVFSKDQVRHRDRQYGASEAGIMAVCLRKGETVELGQSWDQRDGGGGHIWGCKEGVEDNERTL